MKNTYEHNEVEPPKKSPFSSLSCHGRTIEPVIFSKELGIEAPKVDYEGLLQSDDVYIKWSDHFERYGFCFVENCPLDELAQHKVVERIGQLRKPFWEDFYVLGGEQKDEVGRGHVDSSYKNARLEMHTDGSWFDDTPGIQLLHVFQFEGTLWAENILVDGVKLVEKIKEENPYHFRILSSVPLTHSYTDDFISYSSSHVPILLDPETGGLVRIHFSNTKLKPFDKKAFATLRKINPEASMLDLYAAVNTFTKWMSNKEIQFRFVLKPGTILLTDNFRMMHGRTPYIGRRLLRGCYTNIEDWRAVLKIKKEQQ